MNILRTLAPLAAALALAGTAQAQTVLGGGKGGVSFPIVISQSGSYKLANNLVVPAGVDAIHVANGIDVTIDLNGYAIIGPKVCTKAGCDSTTNTQGIRVSSANLQLSNGTIRGFYFGVGFDMSGQQSAVAAHDLIVRGNFVGLHLPRLRGRNLTAVENASLGLSAFVGTIDDSMAQDNGGVGLRLDAGAIRNSASYFNTGSGVQISMGVLSGVAGGWNNVSPQVGAGVVQSGNSL